MLVTIKYENDMSQLIIYQIVTRVEKESKLS